MNKYIHYIAPFWLAACGTEVTDGIARWLSAEPKLVPLSVRSQIVHAGNPGSVWSVGATFTEGAPGRPFQSARIHYSWSTLDENDQATSGFGADIFDSNQPAQAAGALLTRLSVVAHPDMDVVYSLGGFYPDAFPTQGGVSVDRLPLVLPSLQVLRPGADHFVVIHPAGAFASLAQPTAALSTAPAARYDARLVAFGGRLLLYGGTKEEAGQAAFSFDPSTNAWSQVNVDADRRFHTLVGDGDRAFVWGGVNATQELLAGLVLSDNGATTMEVLAPEFPQVAGADFRLVGQSAVRMNEGVLIYGGGRCANPQGGDCFAFTQAPGAHVLAASYLPTENRWTLVKVRDSAFGFRVRHEAVFEPSVNQMFVWGGVGEDGALADQGVVFSPESRWSDLGLSGTQARKGHTAVVAGPEMDDMLVWGGFCPGGDLCQDLVAYNVDSRTWRTVRTDTMAPRYGHVAVWVDAEQQMLVWGGKSVDHTPQSSLLRLTLATGVWEAIEAPVGPVEIESRSDASAVWDPVQRRMLIFGGLRSGACASTLLVFSSDGNTFDESSILDSGLEGRHGHAAVWAQGQMFVWGGECRVTDPATPILSGIILDEASVWQAWNPVAQGGVAPPPVARAAAVWTGTHILVVGSRLQDGAPVVEAGAYFPNGQWQTVRTDQLGAPIGAHLGSMVWLGGHALILGGMQTLDAAEAPDVWPFFHALAFDPEQPGHPGFSHWAGGPPGRVGHTLTAGTDGAIYLVGGSCSRDCRADDPESPCGACAETPSWRFLPNQTLGATPGSGAWAELAGLGNADTPVFHSATWVGTDLVVFGGLVGGAPSARLSIYRHGSGWWVQDLGAVYARYGHVAAWTEGAGPGRLIVFGGRTQSTLLNDTLVIEYSFQAGAHVESLIAPAGPPVGPQSLLMPDRFLERAYDPFNPPWQAGFAGDGNIGAFSYLTLQGQIPLAAHIYRTPQDSFRLLALLPHGKRGDEVSDGHRHERALAVFALDADGGLTDSCPNRTELSFRFVQGSESSTFSVSQKTIEPLWLSTLTATGETSPPPPSATPLPISGQENPNLALVDPRFFSFPDASSENPYQQDEPNQEFLFINRADLSPPAAPQLLVDEEDEYAIVFFNRDFRGQDSQAWQQPLRALDAPARLLSLSIAAPAPELSCEALVQPSAPFADRLVSASRLQSVDLAPTVAVEPMVLVDNHALNGPDSSVDEPSHAQFPPPFQTRFDCFQQGPREGISPQPCFTEWVPYRPVALHRGLDKVVVTQSDAQSVLVFQAMDLGSPKSIDVSEVPVAVAVSEARAEAYVVSRTQGILSIINLRDENVVRTVPIGRLPVTVEVIEAFGEEDRTRVLVLNLGDDALAVYDPESQALAHAATCHRPAEMVVDRVAQRVFVLCKGALAYFGTGAPEERIVPSHTVVFELGTLVP